MATQWEESLAEFEVRADLPSPGLPTGERLIRGFLLGGFFIVLALELWFVLQLLKLM
ncbi:MAG: hypothetical protein ACLFWD_11355 [Anaerolineales bacterium]